MPAAVLAWPGAVAIGVSLGLLGSGGSIITEPVPVHLLGQDEKTAVAGSLFIVGSITLIGSLQYVRLGMVDWRNVVYFGHARHLDRGPACEPDATATAETRLRLLPDRDGRVYSREVAAANAAACGVTKD